MYVLFLILLIAFLVVVAILSINDVKKLKDAVITESLRVKLYKGSIVWQWVPVACILVICAFSLISFKDIGLSGIHLWGPPWFHIIVIIISIGLLVLFIYQILSFIFSAKVREQAEQKFNSTEPKSNYDAIIFNVMIPRTKTEKTAFLFLAASAGVCEEIVWRGFLYFLLLTIFPSWPIGIVIVVGSLIFGAGHFYQGPEGIIKTSIMGGLLGCLYVATGSLLPGMLLHFVVDYSSAFILSDENRDNEGKKSEVNETSNS